MVFWLLYLYILLLDLLSISTNRNIFTLYISMIRFLKVFCIFMVLYQIIHTIIVFGWMDGWYHKVISGSKDVIWIVWCTTIYIFYRKWFAQYLAQMRTLLIILAIAIVRSIGLSWYQWVSISLIIIGFKYILYPFVIMMMSMGIWYCIDDEDWLDKYINRFGKMLRYVMRWWLVRFGIKLRKPEWIMSLWYGPIGDFVVWTNPPLYYRTGAWGWIRYSSLMAWPNNLSYLLIALLPLLHLIWNNWNNKIKKIWIWLSLISLFFTFSRSALVAWCVQLTIMYSYLLKKVKIQYHIILWCVLCIGLFLLLWFKYESTILHVQKIIQWIQIWIQHIWWYGLGYSGPSALHHGSIVPENIYIQRLIDIWWIGFSLIVIYIYQLYYIIKKITKPKYTPYIYAWVIGIIWLSIQWMFLHVLEDSTVNYLVFTIGWVIIGFTYKQQYKSSPTT